MAINIYNPDISPSSLENVSRGNSAGFNPERPFIPSQPQPAGGVVESQFEKALQETIARVNETQNSADQSVARLAAGQEPNIHSTMLELEQAEISLRMAMQVRSKVLDAYQEIMRMQV